MADPKPMRQRRTKANIVAAIQQAAEDEILENGFTSSLVTGIIKRARIEPQVFYNRYRDLDEFYDAYVKKYDYWLSELFKQVEAKLVSEEGLTQLLSEFVSKIASDDMMREILRWEIAQKNATTLRTSALRELHATPVTKGYTKEFEGTDVDIMCTMALMIGGVYYIALHQKLSPFYGIDLSNEEGRRRLKAVLNRIIRHIYAVRNEADEKAGIARRLREHGVSEEIIAECVF